MAHSNAGAEAQQTDVRFQIVGDHSAGQFLRSPAPSRSTVTRPSPSNRERRGRTGRRQGFPFALIDDRAGADRMAFLIVNLQTHARGEQFFNEFWREMRAARGRRGRRSGHIRSRFGRARRQAGLSQTA